MSQFVRLSLRRTERRQQREGDLLKMLKGHRLCFFSQTNVYASTQSQGGKGPREGHSLGEDRRADSVEKLHPFWLIAELCQKPRAHSYFTHLPSGQLKVLQNASLKEQGFLPIPIEPFDELFLLEKAVSDPSDTGIKKPKVPVKIPSAFRHNHHEEGLPEMERKAWRKAAD